jgi:NAD(P) transhydrogenase subunit beta
VDSKVIYDVFYLLAAILFILGVKLMAHPRTARRGNMFGILGMTIAIVISILKANEQLVSLQIFTLFVIGLCCIIGILFGAILATRVKMT